MLFVVVEYFKEGKTQAIYHRFREQGRMIPQGLEYLDSWISADLKQCFQLMECDDLRLLQEWILQWEDLAKFEVIPVVKSKETTEIVTKLLEH